MNNTYAYLVCLLLAPTLHAAAHHKASSEDPFEVVFVNLSKEKMDVTTMRYDALASVVPLEQKTMKEQFCFYAFETAQPYVLVHMPKGLSACITLPDTVVERARCLWKTLTYNPRRLPNASKQKIYLGLLPYYDDDAQQHHIKMAVQRVTLEGEEGNGGKVLMEELLGEYTFACEKKDSKEAAQELCQKVGITIAQKQSQRLFHPSLRRSVE